MIKGLYNKSQPEPIYNCFKTCLCKLLHSFIVPDLYTASTAPITPCTQISTANARPTYSHMAYILQYSQTPHTCSNLVHLSCWLIPWNIHTPKTSPGKY